MSSDCPKAVGLADNELDRLRSRVAELEYFVSVHHELSEAMRHKIAVAKPSEDLHFIGGRGTVGSGGDEAATTTTPSTLPHGCRVRRGRRVARV